MERQETSESAAGVALSSRGRPVRGHYAHEVVAVVFQVRERRLATLLWRRAREPDAGRWSLPGGFVRDEELFGASLARHLADKVDLTDVAYLEQLETRSDVDRDPRERTIATAYLALVAADSAPRLPADTHWHDAEDLPATAFDHASIVASARERLRAKLTYTNAGFALAPASFTIASLREIYEACLGHPLTATNLQRVLTRRGIIEATGATVAPTRVGGRPATLYRFTHHTLVVTDPFAVFRPPTLPD